MVKFSFSVSVELDAAEHHLYDVIVVGAGPAGSSAAYHLANMGVDVLLLDRAAFPRDKRCGDAVMPPAVAELALMGLTDEMGQHFITVERIGQWRKDQPAVYAPIGNSAYVAPRVDFDALLCQQALKQGAKWLEVTVEELVLNQGYALLRARREGRPVRLQARLAIAADGSGSRLARRLLVGEPAANLNALTKPKDDRARFTALRGYFRDVEGLEDTLEFYFLENKIFYYWIFPCGQGLANVGVIASMEQLRTYKVDLGEALMAFLQAPELCGRAMRARLVGPWGAAPIAAGLRGSALFGERLLCVGDAAALVAPHSAEGISSALWSGRVAAETAVAALKSNDFSFTTLSTYGRVVRARYQAMYDRWLEPP